METSSEVAAREEFLGPEVVHVTGAARRAPTATGRPLTAIVAAMRAEVSPLLAKMAVTRRERDAHCRMVSGNLGPTEVVVAWTGEGRVHAEAGVKALFETFDVDRLLILGVAGGLSPDLPAGSLLISESVIDTRSPSNLTGPDAAWLRRGRTINGVSTGVVVTSESILCDIESKRNARKRFADGRSATVDLESATYAREAAARGVRYLVARAISDASDEAFPFDMNRCIDRDGRVSRARVVGRALLNPATMRSLWAFRGRVNRCAESLARFTERLIEVDR